MVKKTGLKKGEEGAIASGEHCRMPKRRSALSIEVSVLRGHHQLQASC